MSGGGGQKQKVEARLPDFFATPAWSFGNQLGQNMESQIGNYRGFFPGQTYAGMSPLTQAGINQMAGPDSPLASASGMTSDYLSRVMGGEYLGMNPAMQQAVMNPAMDAVASRFAGAGRYGSPASQTQMAEAGMRAMAPYYDAERQRMGQAAMMLPGVQQNYANALLQAGGISEGYEQRGIDEAMARHQFDPQLNYLNQVAPLVGLGLGVPGGQTSTSGGGSGLGSALMGGLGGAAMAYPMAGALGVSAPWALGGGALLGGLAGLLG